MSRGWRDGSDWRSWARCLETDPELWFPDSETTTAPARAICATCPVQPECLQLALDTEHGTARTFRFGIFGGLDPHDRLDLQDCGPDQHGTRTGFRLHLARGEEPCLPCRQGRRRRAAPDQKRSA